MFVKQMPITIRKRTGETDPSLALRMTRGVESVGRGFPDGPWCCAGCGARRLGAPNHVSAHCFLLCERTGETFKDHFASLLEKGRFLESKEKGAPKGVEWSQIGIRRLGFTPPLWTSPVYGRLPRRNRDKPWSYPNFFRRLRGWGSGRGGAAWYCRCCGAGWC